MGADNQNTATIAVRVEPEIKARVREHARYAERTIEGLMRLEIRSMLKRLDRQRDEDERAED